MLKYGKENRVNRKQEGKIQISDKNKRGMKSKIEKKSTLST